MMIERDKIETAKHCINMLLMGKHPITEKTVECELLKDEKIINSLIEVLQTLSEADTCIETQLVMIDVLQRNAKGTQLKNSKIPVEKYEQVINDNNKLKRKVLDLELQLSNALEAARADESIIAELTKKVESFGVVKKTEKNKVESKSKPSATTPAVPRYVKPKFNLASYAVQLRKYEMAVPISKEKLQLSDIQQAINTAFTDTTVSVSILRLQNILKDNNLIVNAKYGTQLRLIPTKLGEYYGISIEKLEIDGVDKQVLLFADTAQYALLRLLSESQPKKKTFEYIPDLIKCVPVTSEEISLSEIINRINATYALENMTKLQYDVAVLVLAKKGIMVPNPAGDKPKYIPGEGMKSKGVLFYPADARFSARTAFNEKGQKLVLKTLVWLLAE